MTIPRRDVELGLEPSTVPRDWCHDDAFQTTFMNALSLLFPEGERFFVDSVKAHREGITDPTLRAQITGFIGQEAMHGREHRAFNDRLKELGYPTRFTDRRVKLALSVLGKVAPKRHQLAVTAALEHYTATLAEVILRDGGARGEFTSEEIRTLFTWHALEETEHKSVAFDVFQHVCGSRRVRVGTMYGAHVGFLFAMSTSVAVSLALDPRARNPRRLVRSLRGLRSHPFFGGEVIRRLRDYDRADFHPDDHDTTAMLERWSAELGDMKAAS